MTSGRVSTSTSLLPRRSFGWSSNRSPRKSASVSWCRWIIVPIAPSRTRIRLARSASSCVRTLGVMGFRVLRAFRVSSSRRLTSGRDQHGERIAGLARADADLDVGQARRGQHPPAARRRRTRAAGRRASRAPTPRRARAGRAPARGRPASVTRAASATARAGIARVVQRLRQHRDVDRRVLHRQLLELALLPDDVRDAAAPRQRLGARRARPPSDRRR